MDFLLAVGDQVVRCEVSGSQEGVEDSPLSLVAIIMSFMFVIYFRPYQKFLIGELSILVLIDKIYVADFKGQNSCKCEIFSSIIISSG